MQYLLAGFKIAGTEADFIDDEMEAMQEEVERVHREHVKAMERFAEEQKKALEAGNNGKKP